MPLTTDRPMRASPTGAGIGVPAQKNRWGTIIFLGVIAIATLVSCPIYLWRSDGLTEGEVAFFAFYALASSFSITLGYHRLFSHASFRAAWPIRLLVLIFGGAAFEQSAMRWSALHRRHHRHTDTDRDPYNVKRGFFYAHVGWILFEKPVVDYSTVRDSRQPSLPLAAFLLRAAADGMRRRSPAFWIMPHCSSRLARQ